MRRLVTFSFRNKELPPFSAAFGGRRRRVLDLPLIAWLTFIWVLLWSSLDWANLLTGVLVAVAVCLAFPLPKVDLGLRLHPWGILRLAGYLLYDMYVSGVKVTRQIHGSRTRRAAVVAIPLRCRSDLMLTAVAVAVANVPDSSVVEVRRATATVFVHILDGRPAELAAAQRSVWRTEELIVRAFGTRDEIERVAAPPPPAPHTGPAQDDQEDRP
ncbi:Na+/H+ antiporter subunit E [Streptomyces sp. NPDC088864]|uniref:Na+/H+ antiporter subunit E n=1 Tax=Streptomyces sp. NPDC088864 TaxID=3365910 RepID=UPI00381FFE0B